MKTLTQIYNEHGIWEAKNFPDSNATDNVLGMIEEVGELAHAILKREQGIRVNENHDAEIRDAIADITLFLFGFVKKRYLRIEDVIREASYYVIYTSSDISEFISKLSCAVGGLIHNGYAAGDELSCGRILGNLYIIADILKIDFQDNLNQVWEQVKQRDWNINKKNGGEMKTNEQVNPEYKQAKAIIKDYYLIPGLVFELYNNPLAESVRRGDIIAERKNGIITIRAVQRTEWENMEKQQIQLY